MPGSPARAQLRRAFAPIRRTWPGLVPAPVVGRGRPCHSTTMSILGSSARGITAAAVGTAVMTLSELLEMAISGRKGSPVPGQVGAHLMPGRDPTSSEDVARLNTAVHWAHGIAMGSVRGLLGHAGVTGPAASAAHFALLWSGDAALHRALGVADVPWRWYARRARRRRVPRGGVCRRYRCGVRRAEHQSGGAARGRAFTVDPISLSPARSSSARASRRRPIRVDPRLQA